jgi:hypothetical protein
MPARDQIGGAPSGSPPFPAARPCRPRPRDSIVDLKKLLAERFPPPPPSRQSCLQTGLAVLDHAIEGGLPQGAITEISSPHLSAGTASLIGALILASGERSLKGVPYPLALIDGADSFDVCSLTSRGSLQHLLWVRCGKAMEAVKAADLLLRDGNFPIVILDLVLNSAEELRKIAQTSWYRLQRLVEPSSTVLLVLSRRSMVASAQLNLVLHHRWRLADLDANDALSRLHLRVERSHVRSSELHAHAS